MADLDKLDFDQFVPKKSKRGREKNLDELDFNQFVPKEREVSAGTKALAGIEFLGKGLTLGNLPDIQADLARKLDELGFGEDPRAQAALAAQGIVEQKPSFEQIRQSFAERGQRLGEAAPTIAAVSEGVGTAITASLAAAATGGAGAGVIGGAGIGGGIGFAQAPEGGGFQPLERLKQAGFGAVLGGGSQALFSGIVKAGSSLKGLGASAASKLKDKILKAIGSKAGDFEKISVGRRGEIAEFVLENKLVTPLDDITSIANKATKLRDASGKEIGVIFDELESAQGINIFPLKDVTESLKKSIRTGIGSKKVDKKAAINTVESIIDEGLEGKITARSLLDFRKEVDERIKFAQNVLAPEPEIKQLALIGVRNGVNKLIANKAEQVGSKALRQTLKEANRKFSVAATISRIASKKSAQDAARSQAFGDITLGALGGLAGTAEGGPGFIKGAIGGLAARRAARLIPALNVGLTRGLTIPASRVLSPIGASIQRATGLVPAGLPAALGAGFGGRNR